MRLRRNAYAVAPERGSRLADEVNSEGRQKAHPTVRPMASRALPSCLRPVSRGRAYGEIAPLRRKPKNMPGERTLCAVPRANRGKSEILGKLQLDACLTVHEKKC